MAFPPCVGSYAPSDQAAIIPAAAVPRKPSRGGRSPLQKGTARRACRQIVESRAAARRASVTISSAFGVHNANRSVALVLFA
jgi:hypothetical protein